MNEKNTKLTPVVITTVLCSIAYISFIFNRNVWLDEAFTATLVHADYATVLQRSMADTLPPLYNLFLKFMTDLFGYDVPVMKLASIIPMIATMIVSAVVVRKRFGSFAAVIFNLCITFMPLMFYYGLEIRMYSLGFFFATSAGILAYEVVVDSNRRNWIAFTCFSVLAGYSHHFAFVTVGFIYLGLLIYYFFFERVNIKRWFICLMATFVLYFPCLIVTLKQLKSVSGYFSMPEVTISLFVQYMIYPFTVGFTPASILLLIAVVALLVILAVRIVHFVLSVRKTEGSLSSQQEGEGQKSVSADYENPIYRDGYCLCCFLIYYGVLIFGTIISKIMTANIFVDRYLFFSTGLIWLFFAISITALTGKIKLPAVIFCVLIGVASYVVMFENEYGNSASEEMDYIAGQVGEGDVLYTIEEDEELAFCLPFYTILATGDENLKNYEDLNDAIKAADATDSTLWVAVMGEGAITPEGEERIKKSGRNINTAVPFEFDRYHCMLYECN